MKKLNSKAQSVVEYMIIIVLIMSATIVTGPYVIRSIYAHFKSLDSAVYDTFHDPLKETGDTLDLEMPECNDTSCEYVKPCIGEVCCGYGSCSATETSLMNKCNPQRCEPITWQCTPTPECCDKKKSTGICFNSLEYSSYGFHIENYTECSNRNSEVVKQTCGDNSDKYYCNESFNCTAKCTNFPGTAEGMCKDLGSLFGGDEDDENGLFQNQDYVVVGRSTDCPTDVGATNSSECRGAGYTGCTQNRKCQALCPDRYSVDLKNNKCNKDICMDQISKASSVFQYNLDPLSVNGEYYVTCQHQTQRDLLNDGDPNTGCELIVDSNGGAGWGEQIITYIFNSSVEINKIAYAGFKVGQSFLCDPLGDYSNEIELEVNGAWVSTGISICDNVDPNYTIISKASAEDDEWQKVTAARLPVRIRVDENGEYKWKGTEFQVSTCKAPGQWVNRGGPIHNNPVTSCGAVCGSASMVPALSPEGLTCASARVFPCNNLDQIHFPWGLYAGCTNGPTSSVVTNRRYSTKNPNPVTYCIEPGDHGIQGHAWYLAACYCGGS